ncbi:NAD-dependent epimerase/dehydratase family protein [Micromonospora sp. NPDC048871]|uniref:NAD-dependent epimerase/dehydratase family protein n=1 Tax=unclassified Micromonospora TaxID=2617518 RepID=UPI002E1433A9|nr:hypothetical protein OIE53_11570 [Micromonospora sp. NBC_01739]
MTKRTLVTGGTGFICSHYVRRLLSPDVPGDVSVTARAGRTARTQDAAAGSTALHHGSSTAACNGDAANAQYALGLLK